MQTHYIGFTDPQTPEQVRQVLHNVPPLTNIKLHVGMMTSRKKLAGQPTKYDRVWLPPEELSLPFLDDQRVMNVVHYADYTGLDAFDQIQQCIRLGGERLHGIQLDMSWPNPHQLVRAILDSNNPNVEVILQIGKDAFKQITNHTQEQTIDNFLVTLSRYRDVLTHVLLDRSMGKGESMTADFFRPYIDAIQDTFPRLGIVVAGGLGPETLHLVEPLIERYPFLSIDAQGQLRNSGDSKDPIDMERVCQYVKSAYQLYTLKHPLSYS